MTDDTRKLLGGYATGTLSDTEKKELFDAALQDDDLFAALADEQVLKELLEDGAVRAQVLRATEEPRFTLAGAFREWFERPKAKAVVATGAVLLTIIGFRAIRQSEPVRRASVPAEVALERPAQLREMPREPSSPAAQPRVEKNKTADAPQLKHKRDTTRTETKKESEQTVASADPAPPTAEKAVAPAESRDLAAARMAEPANPAMAGGVIGGVPPTPRALTAFRAASAPVAPLRYELLLRETNGDYRPVRSDYEFIAGDSLRIRIRSNRNGAVAISSSSQPTVVVPVLANQAVVLPADGAIVVNAATTKIVLAFSATEAELESMRRDFAPGVAMSQQATAPSSNTIEIPIRQQKP